MCLGPISYLNKVIRKLMKELFYLNRHLKMSTLTKFSPFSYKTDFYLQISKSVLIGMPEVSTQSRDEKSTSAIIVWGQNGLLPASNSTH